MSLDNEAIWALLSLELRMIGYELVAVRWLSQHGRRVFQVFIDFPQEGSLLEDGEDSPGQGTIQLKDCSKANRMLLELDALEELAPGKFHFEVSSPGIERPIQKVEDFERFAGRRVRIKMRGLHEGRRRFLGTLLGVVDGAVELLTEGEKRTFLLPLANIIRANLKPSQAELFAPKA